MESNNTGYIIANFGGPRSLSEIPSFLIALLTDQEVVRTPLPRSLHRVLFTFIAKKRAGRVAKEYAAIGGKSPIYAETEAVANCLRKHFKGPIAAFHRYLPDTHESFIRSIAEAHCKEWRIFSMFPQFSYATTGSIAHWFQQHLPSQILEKCRWVKSYPEHPAFILAQQNCMRSFLKKNKLNEEESLFLFSAHGIPQSFVKRGDPYEEECRASYNAVMQDFPNARSALAYQSKFGPGEWLKPYTADVCKEILIRNQNRQNIIFVPISFTSDHLETLFEMENIYMPIIRQQGLNAFRIPAMSLDPNWIKAIVTLLEYADLCGCKKLIRKK